LRDFLVLNCCVETLAAASRSVEKIG